MSLPKHYRDFYGCFVKLSCWMVFLALISGILFQESTRKIPIAKFGAGIHWEAVYHLALTHGHVFLIGVLIPLAVVGMLQIGQLLEGKTVSEKTLEWGGRLYWAGAIPAVALMLYKGYHYVLSVRGGLTDFGMINHQYFGGVEVARQVIYGLSHTVMSIGLIWLVIGVLRSIPGKKASD